MSLIAFLGISGTIISTIVLLPHLVYAYETRTPPGNASAWLLSTLSAAIWTSYGLLTHQATVAAPGVVGIPVALFLFFWCVRNNARVLPSKPISLVYRAEVFNTPEDTLEMPRIL